VGVGGIPGTAPQLPDQTEQAAPRRVTLTESEERSRSGGGQWKREANDGWESRQGSKSEIHSLEAGGVNSAVWVRVRAGHGGQGSSPKLDHPVNLSWVSAPDVRYCRIKTTPHVEMKDLLETDHRTVILSGSE
jgi:hypothetical protein